LLVFAVFLHEVETELTGKGDPNAETENSGLVLKTDVCCGLDKLPEENIFGVPVACDSTGVLDEPGPKLVPNNDGVGCLGMVLGIGDGSCSVVNSDGVIDGSRGDDSFCNEI